MCLDLGYNPEKGVKKMTRHSDRHTEKSIIIQILFTLDEMIFKPLIPKNSFIFSQLKPKQFQIYKNITKFD